MNYREIGIRAALKQAGVEIKDDKEDKDDNACETPGEKIRSKGKGRGLARGKGKGPLGIPLGEKGEVWRALAEKDASDYHEIGIQLALQDAGLVKEAQLNPEQLEAAKQLFGIGGGLAGATGGGLLGRYLGGGLADKLDIDPETGKMVGAGLGALGGGALGGLAGYNLARLKYPGKTPAPAEEPAASASFIPDEFQQGQGYGLYPDLYY